MEEIGSWLGSHDLTGIAGLLLVAILVLTDKLVWHTRLAKAEARCDRWEGIALKALGVADKVTATVESVEESERGAT